MSRINVLFSLQGANILLTDGGDVKLGKVHMHIVHVCNPDVYQCVCVYVLYIVCPGIGENIKLAIKLRISLDSMPSLTRRSL